MEDRHRLVTWSASVLAGALSAAALAASQTRKSLWHDLWFTASAVVAGAAFLILVVSGTPDLVSWIRNRERLPSVSINSPEADQRVTQAMMARGSAARIPDDVTLWLIVQAGHSFYPQTKILLPQGRAGDWVQLVHFGRVGGSIGHEYTLYVVGADRAANSRLEIYKQKQAADPGTAPLSDARGTLPKMTTYVAVNVIRGP